MTEAYRKPLDRATPEEIARARRLYGEDGEVEIDDDAPVLRGVPEDGFWVQAWVWLEKQ